MSGLVEAQGIGLKSLVDHQQLLHYCHQLPSRLGTSTHTVMPSKEKRIGP